MIEINCGHKTRYVDIVVILTCIERHALYPMTGNNMR